MEKLNENMIGKNMNIEHKKMRISAILLTCFTFCLILLFSQDIYSQNKAQTNLLNKAYKKHSLPLLYKFFDKWSNEISSNESDAPNKWIKEAHKVYISIYNPLQPDKIGIHYNCTIDSTVYHKNLYFIVQNTLASISVADNIPYTCEDLQSYYISRINQLYTEDSIREINIKRIPNLFRMDGYSPHFGEHPWPWVKIHTTEIDSNIVFRPPVHFPNKKIVYLTDEYKKILDNFLKGERNDSSAFIQNASKIIYGHFGGYWQYITYPQVYSIIFDTQMRRAYVSYRFIYQGGYIILEKQNGEWIIVSTHITWQE